ncbi:hypothetical protein NKT34_11295 [Paenibacillus polysaccharolyticus]|uniref:Spore protein n=1 Tax=Paenibacillus cucumis (ex Kampfer et al. 2016) TaxID=1776858 RepID=A0ABS7KGB9_9BACL|nr:MULTISPECIES: hypothetical protein [Paenibacillus]MBY0203178.1 hypothetical protein [Paenibacillus cucumis (ex Kampfer et al. 2016)]MCP1133877.1 hypothetical protein [Paenibacillus polysaccharolyticus]MDP9697816.1 putative lipid-binding transport protein (Tim44 family) [Paenibacillus intestini]
MAKTNEIHVKAKRFKDRPVCVTLHNGETYIGYISGVSNEGVELTGGGKFTQTSTTTAKKARAVRSRDRQMKNKPIKSNKSVSSSSRKKVNRSRKSSVQPRVTSHRSSRQRQAQVSSFMPMMGSLLGGLGGAGSFGGMLGGGMRLFGMIQRFVPVVKMGYGMIKQIQPFMGAVQGLMSPASQASQTEDEAEAEAETQRG